MHPKFFVPIALLLVSPVADGVPARLAVTADASLVPASTRLATTRLIRTDIEAKHARNDTEQLEAGRLPGRGGDLAEEGRKPRQHHVEGRTRLQKEVGHLLDHDQYSHKYYLTMMYPVAIVGTAGLIVALYASQGALVVCKVLIYLAALTSIKGVVKYLVADLGFNYPLFITGTHFLFGTIASFAMLANSACSAPLQLLKVPARKEFAFFFVPIGICFALNVGMNNVALVYSTTAFVEIVSGASPVVAILLQLMMGEKVNAVLLAPCFLVCCGCALCSKGDVRFSTFGFALAFGANVPRALRGLLQQRAMRALNVEEKESQPFSPLEVLAWSSIPSLLVMYAASLCVEGLAPWSQLLHRANSISRIAVLLLSCVNACILNLISLYVLKDLGTAGMFIVAQTKSILVVLSGVCLLRETVTPVEICGFLAVMGGVYFYNDLSARFKEKAKAEVNGVKQ